MCTHWNGAQWLANSQPANPTSIYTLVDTRYNLEGQPARTYSEEDGWFWGVLPDEYESFTPADAHKYGTTPQAAAIAYLSSYGYTLSDPPALITRDTVENFA